MEYLRMKKYSQSLNAEGFPENLREDIEYLGKKDTDVKYLSVEDSTKIHVYTDITLKRMEKLGKDNSIDSKICELKPIIDDYYKVVVPYLIYDNETYTLSESSTVSDLIGFLRTYVYEAKKDVTIPVVDTIKIFIDKKHIKEDLKVRFIDKHLNNIDSLLDVKKYVIKLYNILTTYINVLPYINKEKNEGKLNPMVEYFSKIHSQLSEYVNGEKDNQINVYDIISVISEDLKNFMKDLSRPSFFRIKSIATILQYVKDKDSLENKHFNLLLLTVLYFQGKISITTENEEKNIKTLRIEDKSFGFMIEEKLNEKDIDNTTLDFVGLYYPYFMELFQVQQNHNLCESDKENISITKGTNECQMVTIIQKILSDLRKEYNISNKMKIVMDNIYKKLKYEVNNK